MSVCDMFCFFLDALIPICVCYLFQNLPGVELHRQRFLWTHTESERQGQTKDICCQSQSFRTKHNLLYCHYSFLICIAFIRLYLKLRF